MFKEAQDVDKFIESGANFDNLPLLGVPFTCKELTWVKGRNMKNIYYYYIKF